MDAKQREQVRQRIQEEYERGDWSLKRLAAASGVAPNTIASLKNGTRDTHDDQIGKVLKALGIEPPDRNADMLDLNDVPEDVQAFLRAARDRMKIMPVEERSPLLNIFYDKLIRGITHNSGISDV
jgi:transcriptional regulator with XRE-family HTH domain